MNRLALAVALCCFACAGARKQAEPPPKLNRWGTPWKEGIAVPAWVERVPESGNGKLVAVGYSQPSFWPQDAINAAADDARGKLALALASHVEVLGLDAATGAAIGSGAIINKEATDVVMQNSHLEATWTDENGERSEPGGVWTLAMLEIDSIKGKTRLDAPAAPAAGKSGPSWLDHLPGSKGRIYATGYSGPTYHAEDAKRYAGEDAIDNLAASLRAHVQAYTLLVESASGLTVDQFSRTVDDPDTAFRDLVRKNAKLEATWVDRDGSRPGDPPGAVWALASIDVQSTAGAVKPVENRDLGPALDREGNAPPEP
ncbi:MAG: hypothetical protein AUI90_08080 [Deltaproteobacteria bacterium 13_1_40CM_3_69_14]|nr:MAG: hypothetical protein AUI90_08080 [Deltaproteobacteria bacterium 13_1_40CM_3_69_14]